MKLVQFIVQLFITLLILHNTECFCFNPVQPTPAEGEQESTNEKLKITIFYATQCPYSIRFFKEQLPKLFENESGGLYRYIDFDIVPYIQDAHKDGNKWVYKCIHGVQECQYSKLHSCILNEFPPNKSTDDFKQLVPLLICLMDTKHEVQVIPQCVKKYNISDTKLMMCLSNNDLVGELMTSNLKRAENSQPPVTQAPTIQFNEVYDKTESTTAEYNIIKAVCNHLKEKPQVCQTINDVHYYYSNKIDVYII